MSNFRDLTGQKFNFLTAIKLVGKDNNKHTLWLFECDCGNEKVIRGTNVTNGHIKSCGCKMKCYFNNESEKHKFYNKHLHGDKLRSKTDLYKNNTSGVTGVHQRKSDGRYTCYICVNGVKKSTTKSNFYDAVKWREDHLKRYQLGVARDIKK